MAKAKKVPQHAPGDVFYFEFYPHYSGTTTCGWWMKPVTFAMMRLLWAEYDRADKTFDEVVKRMRKRFGQNAEFNKFTDTPRAKWAKSPLVLEYLDRLDEVDTAGEVYEDFCDEIKRENGNKTSFAIGELLQNSPRAIDRGLSRKGVFAADWEEGSHAFSVVGEAAAVDAVRKIEFQAMEDCGEIW